MAKINDFVITVATVNGSGSQSANLILVRTLFAMGLPVGGKNLFPSNIQGLPTWFTIRVNENGFTARRKFADILVAMNAQTASEDLAQVGPNGHFFYNAEFKLDVANQRPDIKAYAIPFRELVTPLSESVKARKLLVNMIYVGVMAELLGLDKMLESVVRHSFADKEQLLQANLDAVRVGREYARAHLEPAAYPWKVASLGPLNENRMLVDGNSSAALGLVMGGCGFVSWYPITPSSSLVETYADLADRHLRDDKGRAGFAVVQAEDELAAINMVVGAGWAGARAATATSGPGLSLMAEAAGLSYYAEIPAVIWNVQRVGPSTGLPTRTQQGDLLAAYHLSHGDTKHVVLLPGTPEECYEFAGVALDLAEQLQTLVIVLSDLDLGMNLFISPQFQYPEQPIARGKVLHADDLNGLASFERYLDRDGDGIAYRTLPGCRHEKAAYFTRGTGHDTAGRYSESPIAYKDNLDRLKRKYETAAQLVPKPLTDCRPDVKIGFLTFGSNCEALGEARFLLQGRGISTNCLRVRALPLALEVEEFLLNHDSVYVVEQNRDGQMLSVLRAELPHVAWRCKSILHYNGLPPDAESIVDQFLTAQACVKEVSQ